MNIHDSIQLGDIEAERRELANGSSVDSSDDRDFTPLAYAASSPSADDSMPKLLSWLVDAWADLEAVDDKEATALMLAAQAGRIDCVRLLLEAAAIWNRKNEYGNSTMSTASCEGVMRLLIGSGGDIAEISPESKRVLLGLQNGKSLNVTKEEYRSGCRPRFGKSNPEVMGIPFWHQMVQAGILSYQAKAQFNDVDNTSDATWYFSRFGGSSRSYLMAGSSKSMVNVKTTTFPISAFITTCSFMVQADGFRSWAIPKRCFHQQTFTRRNISTGSSRSLAVWAIKAHGNLKQRRSTD